MVLRRRASRARAPLKPFINWFIGEYFTTLSSFLRASKVFRPPHFASNFGFFSRLRPRKLILSIFPKSKRPFGKQTTPRLVTYYYLSMDKRWAKFKFWVWPPVARYLQTLTLKTSDGFSSTKVAKFELYQEQSICWILRVSTQLQ